MKNYKNKNPRYSETQDWVVNEAEAQYYSRGNVCLYCYKKLSSDEHKYHKACCKKFFGQDYVPSLDYTQASMAELAKSYLKTNMAVTGVQAKVSLSWHKKSDKNELKKLTIVGLYGDYILKPPSDYYESLPELEHCTMKMADVCGLSTVPNTLFELSDGTVCYLTKRVDRSRKGMKHMEDMCQLAERLTEDKYKGSHEQVAKLLLKYSDLPMLDVSNFYEYVVFSFLTGNADMHLKNFSLLETEEQGKYALSPAYDMLNTTMVNPEDKEELALTLNGKKSKLKKDDFLAAFLNAGLSEKQLNKTLENFYYCRFEMFDVVHNSFLSPVLKQGYEQLLKSRYLRLGLSF